MCLKLILDCIVTSMFTSISLNLTKLKWELPSQLQTVQEGDNLPFRVNSFVFVVPGYTLRVADFLFHIRRDSCNLMGKKMS